jgi:rubrerythrin
MEKASYRNYIAAGDLAETPDVKEVFQRLAAEEDQHYQMLENTLDYLNSSGQWFLFSEGGLLTGDMSSLG